MNIKKWKIAPLTELARRMFGKKYDSIKTRKCYGCSTLIPAGRAFCDPCFYNENPKEVNKNGK